MGSVVMCSQYRIQLQDTLHTGHTAHRTHCTQDTLHTGHTAHRTHCIEDTLPSLHTGHSHGEGLASQPDRLESGAGPVQCRGKYPAKRCPVPLPPPQVSSLDLPLLVLQLSDGEPGGERLELELDRGELDRLVGHCRDIRDQLDRLDL